MTKCMRNFALLMTIAMVATTLIISGRGVGDCYDCVMITTLTHACMYFNMRVPDQGEERVNASGRSPCVWVRGSVRHVNV